MYAQNPINNLSVFWAPALNTLFQQQQQQQQQQNKKGKKNSRSNKSLKYWR